MQGQNSAVPHSQDFPKSSFGDQNSENGCLKKNSVSSGWQPFFRACTSSQDSTLTTKEKEATIEHE